jgi:flagellum-specific peptidoglycan hydrolase FlgJ
MLERVSKRCPSPLAKSPAGSFGKRVPESLRREIQPRLGIDFSRIRIHADAAAARSAAALGAEAYAVGHDIVFGANAYRPGSIEGRRLLLHELAHVAQREKGAAAAGSGGRRFADASLDRNADQVADAVLLGRTPRVQAGSFQVGLKPKVPEYKQHPCDDKEPTNAKIIGFIKAHRADAESVGKKAGVPSDWILAVAAEETNYGTSGIVLRTNNYFGLHVSGENDTNHFDGQTGVEKTKGKPPVFVAVFGSSSGFKDSGMGFAKIEQSNISGITEFPKFAQTIHEHGYGVNTASYVSDLINVHDLIAARIDCAAAK